MNEHLRLEVVPGGRENAALPESGPVYGSKEYRKYAGERIAEVLNHVDQALRTYPPKIKTCLERTISLCENSPELAHLIPSLRIEIDKMTQKTALVDSVEYRRALDTFEDLIDGTSEDPQRYELALESIKILEHQVEDLRVGDQRGQEDLARLGIKLGILSQGS